VLADIIMGSAIESLIDTYFEQRSSLLHDVALALLIGDLAEDDATTIHWQATCTMGIPKHMIDKLEPMPFDSEHPLALIMNSMQTGWGDADPAYGPLFVEHYWCATPASHTLHTTTPRAVLLGLSDQAFDDAQRAAFESLAALIAAVLAGAEAALRQHRESDQLTLLMHYAANPIILCDATSVITMNTPALVLFDVASISEGEDQPLQIAIVQRNLTCLQDFLGEVNQQESSVHMGELLLQDPRTQEEIVMAVASTQVPDAVGGERGTVLVLHDMTRARELEQHRIRQQLFESEKLAATGRLAASIAHEINNPLEAIKNSLYLLVRQTKPDDPNRQFLELAQRETERVSRIIRQMLGVSRPSVAMAPTRVNDVLHDALQLLGPQLRQGRINLTLQVDETLPAVMASADQLKQVFLNLLLNAKEAMPKGGGLLVQIRMATASDADYLAGRHVLIRIRDDGAGIPPDILPHVFEPFFSTKNDRHGTGLGLWVCQDIIQRHNGYILVRSMVGKGTTFLVALPFITPPAIQEGADV
jgi:signal transduction histidine kinase